MPPFPGIPYGAAPFYCFPLTELCMYALFLLCLAHALKQGLQHVCYLLGGVLFGLILEYVNVNANMGYVYGQFMVMLGKAPLNIPLCIGIGWGVIMYSARLFTDALQLPLWTCVALDTLLAINIDISMDVVAYRLHMWHWDWSDSGLNPLTADWFGIPFGNFFGWLLVVFFYSSSSRLLEKAFRISSGARTIKTLMVPLLSVILSQVALYVMLVYVDRFMYNTFGITPLLRFVVFIIVLLLMVMMGWSKKRVAGLADVPLVSWLVPAWFHVFFFIWLFAGGFYAESPWLVGAAFLNLLIGASVHASVMRAKPYAGLHAEAFQ